MRCSVAHGSLLLIYAFVPVLASDSDRAEANVSECFKYCVCVVCSVASESAAGKVILDPDLWTKLAPVPPSPEALDDCT